jgi:hypothetical protein
MIPTTYKTEAEALAIRSSYGEGSLLAGQSPTGSTSTNPSLGGVLSADALARIQGTDLTGVTSTISTTVSGGFTTADAAYIDGMRTRLTDSITEFYASKPNLSPFNANNKLSGQSDANVRDNFLQAIFKYDARYGQRLRLDETEAINKLDTGEYVLPNRTSFIKNPYVEVLMREHGPSDINSIDDTGTGGAYRVTTASIHGLYGGMLVSARPGATAPSPIVETHVEKTITKLKQQSTTTTSEPTDSYYTTSANHYLVTGQKFVPTNGELYTGLDPYDRFWGYQRDRYVKVLSPTTFELHRTYASATGTGTTDRIVAGYYNGSMNFSQEGTGPFYVSGATMQTIDGMPILFDSTGSTNTSICVFQRDTISSVDTSTGIWTTTATIKDGVQDGMLTNFNAFTGTTWTAIDSYNYPLYFKKVDNTHFTLHTSSTTLNSTTLWKPGTTDNLDLDAIQYTSSTWTATFTRTHNLINGQDFRMRSVGSDFGGQAILKYNYVSSNSASNYWEVSDTANNFMEGARVYISTNTDGGSGTKFDIASTEVTVPQNGLYVKVKAAKQIQLFTDAAMTTQWQPYTVAGNHTVEADTFVANIYFAKVVDGNTVQLYKESTLTTKWIPGGTVTAITSGATGNTLATGIVTSFNSPGGGYIQPMFFPKTEGYSYISLYKDQALTLPYSISGGGVISGSTLSAGAGSLDLTDLGSGTFAIDNYEATTGCYRMNNISHFMSFVDNGNSTITSEFNFSNSKIFPAFYIYKVSQTSFDLYVDIDCTVPYTTPAIGTAGATSTAGSMIAAVYQQPGGYRVDKVIGRNIGLLTYFYNNYDTDTVGVNGQPSTTFYVPHFQGNSVFEYGTGNENRWPAFAVAEYSNTNAGAYYGHLRPCKSGSSDAGNTGRLGIDASTYGVTNGSPVYYSLNQPGRFTSSAPMILGIRTQADVGTYTEDPLEYNGVIWDQGSEGQQYRDWPQTVQPVSMTWTIEQPTQVLETVNMNRYTRTRDVAQYRLKLTYPPMTRDQFQVFAGTIHAARGAYKPFKFWFPRDSSNIAMTISMQSKSPQVSNHFFVREGLTAGTKIIKVDGMPPNKTENDPALYMGAGLNMRISNGLGSMMVPISNVRTNEYGEANIRINNGIPSSIAAGEWMDTYINYLDVFLDGNSIDIKVDTRGFHYLEVDMVTKRIF